MTEWGPLMSEDADWWAVPGHVPPARMLVAAVAVAIVEDLDTGSASLEGLAKALASVAEERHRQNQRWGAQHHPPGVWLAVLAEEVGEVAREVAPLTERTDGWAPRVLVDPLLDAESAARWVLAAHHPVRR